jgi:hypothetical protein
MNGLKERVTEDGPRNYNVGYKAVDGISETVENEHSVLRCYPTGKFSPQPFVEGSREQLEKVAAAVRQKYGLSFPGAVEGWRHFLDEAPQSDNVEEYIAKHPLYIPLKKELFHLTSEEDVDR